MLVRSMRGQGIFRRKKHDVFLTEVLWGENVGLLPEGDRWFTIYFAQHRLARFVRIQSRAFAAFFLSVLLPTSWKRCSSPALVKKSAARFGL